VKVSALPGQYHITSSAGVAAARKAVLTAPGASERTEHRAGCSLTPPARSAESTTGGHRRTHLTGKE
jgi:hypothetical protein